MVYIVDDALLGYLFCLVIDFYDLLIIFHVDFFEWKLVVVERVELYCAYLYLYAQSMACCLMRSSLLNACFNLR